MCAVRLEADQLLAGNPSDGSAHGDEVGGRPLHDRWTRRLPLGLPQQLASFAGFGQLAVAFDVDALDLAVELVLRRDVTGGRVQADRVAMGDGFGHEGRAF